MKNLLRLNLLIVIVTIVVTACGTTGNGVLYTERSIVPTDVKYQRVAVLPNRLPLNLQDPEKWKKFNWNVMKTRFEKEGFQIVDYSTSVEMFNKSGLPLEDTKVSRDKYAELAEEMNADILIFPYYGTSYRVTGITDKNNYEVVGSLQVYLAHQNDFMTRIDIEGDNYFNTYNKIVPVAGLLITFIVQAVAEDPNAVIVASLITPIASIATLIPYLTPANKRWEKAFRKAINIGLDQFFAKYQGRSTSSVPAKVTPAVNTRANSPAPKPAAAPAAASPETEKPLSSMTIDELQRLKQQAIDTKNFKRAAAIKEELDKRTKK
jgi:hypothetical protein